MLFLKIVAIVFLVYVGVVVAFESLLGYFQPQSGQTMVITTTDDGGNPHERVVSRLESGGQLYVAVNHWPRAWYGRVLAHPNVQITMDGKTGNYRAVRVEGEEYARVNAEHPLGPVVRILTGFPPRRILRLDPIGGAQTEG